MSRSSPDHDFSSSEASTWPSGDGRWTEGGEEGTFLVLAPAGGESDVLREILARGGISCTICPEMHALCERIERGAHGALLAEEALQPAGLHQLRRTLLKQPSWSDFPLIVMTAVDGSAERTWRVVEGIEGVAHATLLERPCSAMALLSSIRVAIQSRRRQYELREQLAQRERATAALQESERQLRMITDAAPVLIAAVNRQECYEFANSRYAELFGWTPDRIIGASLREVIGEAAYGRVRRYIQRVLAGEPVAFEEERVRADARSVSLLVRLVPRHGPEGETLGFYAAAADISEQKRTEAALRASEERFRLAVAAADVGTWNIDLETNLETRDACLNRILGLPAEATTSPAEEFAQRLHPEDRAASDEAWRRAVEAGEVYLVESRILRPSGEVRWIHDRGRVFYDQRGVPVYATGAVVDITDRKTFEHSLQEARRAADQANRAKSEFLANVSHEIRTPMTAVLGYTDVLREQIDGPEALESLETIRQNGTYLLELINDILDLSKLEAGALELCCEQFALAGLLEEVWSSMQGRASERGIRLVIEQVGMLPQAIYNDRVRLHQVLINLVGNAIKFTERGEVRVRAGFEWIRNAKATPPESGCEARAEPRSEQGRLWFEVSDTGIGMTADQMSRLFRPFIQGDASVTRRFGGIGLGLAISDGLIDMLGGEILVESEPGRGSTFRFSVATGLVEHVGWIAPHNGDPESGEGGEASVGTAVIELRQEAPIDLACHVLVVDDGRDIRLLVRRFLESRGATTEAVDNGADAVDRVLAARRPAVALVVLDMQMPIMDGYTAARQMRQGGYRGPIIALTANTLQGDRERCLEAGCTEFLPKPIDQDRLIRLAARLTGAA